MPSTTSFAASKWTVRFCSKWSMQVPPMCSAASPLRRAMLQDAAGEEPGGAPTCTKGKKKATRSSSRCIEFGPSAAELALLAGLGALAASEGAALIGSAAARAGTGRFARRLGRGFSQPVDGKAQARWQAMRASWVAPHIGLVWPSVLSRLPYGAKTQPVSAFAFEEVADASARPRSCRGGLPRSIWRACWRAPTPTRAGTCRPNLRSNCRICRLSSTAARQPAAAGGGRNVHERTAGAGACSIGRDAADQPPQPAARAGWQPGAASASAQPRTEGAMGSR